MLGILWWLGLWSIWLRSFQKSFEALLLFVFVISYGSLWLNQFQLNNPPAYITQEVQSISKLRPSYDVIVTGTDPEGVVAAVSAARSGLRTLLIDGHNREILGGLMTRGWLNSLDLNYASFKSNVPGKHNMLNKGIFQEWYDMVEGDSFDVTTAANAFYNLVRKEKNIDLLLQVQNMQPILRTNLNRKEIVGLEVTKADGIRQIVSAKSIIDATQDADIAAAAQVPFTIGWEDLGDKQSRMAVTVVFRLKNVTDDIWQQIQKRLRNDGNVDTDANERSAWGYANMKFYQPFHETRVRMRGLNIGRQNDGTILINALQIFGIDRFDPISQKEAFDLAKSEIPYVLDYMKRRYSEFGELQWDGIAPELYVRETRHLVGEYRLSMVDVLDNRDHWDRIAFGSYQVDIQRTSTKDYNEIVSSPIQYAIPFRSLVPREVDGLLVVGRSASFDALAHGSARVIPVGMATGEAAGVAAHITKKDGITFRELSQSKKGISLLQDKLNKQGMDIKPFTVDAPSYAMNKYYPGLKTAVSFNLTNGGYDNKQFNLDGFANPQQLVNQMLVVAKVLPQAFKQDPSSAIATLVDAKKLALSLEQAAFIYTNAIGINTQRELALVVLVTKGLVKESTLEQIENKQSLTNGDVYMMMRDIVTGLTGKTYD